jgi:hypothetical protein
VFVQGADPPYFHPVDCRRLVLQRHRRGERFERRVGVAQAERAQALRQPHRCRRGADVPHHLLDPGGQPSDLGDCAGDLLGVIGKPESTDARPTPLRADRETEALVGVSIGTFRRFDEEVRILGKGDER